MIFYLYSGLLLFGIYLIVYKLYDFIKYIKINDKRNHEALLEAINDPYFYTKYEKEAILHTRIQTSLLQNIAEKNEINTKLSVENANHKWVIWYDKHKEKIRKELESLNL